MRKKLKLSCLVAPIAALAFLALSGPATAGDTQQLNPGFFADPQDTNVPYVGWVGDKIRLVKCEAGLVAGTGNWALTDWSRGLEEDGSPAVQPSFMLAANGRPGFPANGPDQAGRNCWEMIVTSQKAGLAEIKLETSGTTPTLTHDFIVIFLSMNTPVLDELGDNEIPGLLVGDPAGDGDFEPIGGAFLDGFFQVDVTGSFPLGRNYTRRLDNDPDVDTVTLPNDWSALANAFGVSKRSAVDPSGWDIHDDQSNREGHTATSICGGAAARDAVDTCQGWNFEFDPFSRLVGRTFPLTIGPFDPLRPSSSYLPDGIVDSGDAPMPALRINVGVTGGFGALASADKHLIYNRNTASTLHELYAPFYISFIPATRAAGVFGTSSGTTGELANNFPGFLGSALFGIPGLYHFWDLLETGSRSGDNNCFDVGGDGQFEDEEDGDAIGRPSGIDEGSVYTDEHGEAIVRFLPDVGVDLVADSQGLCDLGEISDTPRLIATATISAQAELPFQQAQRPINAVPSLTKQLFSLAGKSLDCVPKSAIEAFCVETIRDIRGNPVAGAEVAFSREPRGKIEGANLPADPDADTFVGPAGDSGFNTLGSRCSTSVLGSLNEIVCTTNALGQAGIVVKSTLPGLVDIDAENIGTRNGGFGVQRVRCLRFAGDGATLVTDSATCVAPPVAPVAPVVPVVPVVPGVIPVVPVTIPVTIQGGVAPAAIVVSLAGKPIPATEPAAKPAVKPAAKAAATKLSSARLIVVNGKRYLVVRANGAAATAKVRITLVMRTGKANAPVVRTIRTNKAVRVANLLINKHVRTVRVSLVK